MRRLTREDLKNAKINPRKRLIGNQVYKILTTSHRGRDNVICADQIAEEVAMNIGEDVTRNDINEAVRLMNKYHVLPGLNSCSKGYYIDDSLTEMLSSLRFILNKCIAMKHNITSVYDMIVKRYGAGNIPDDMFEAISGLGELSLDESPDDDDEYEYGEN